MAELFGFDACASREIAARVLEAGVGKARLPLLTTAPLSAADVVRNLVPVVFGNIIGGSVLAALVYWVVYPRPGARPAEPET